MGFIYILSIKVELDDMRRKLYLDFFSPFPSVMDGGLFYYLNILLMQTQNKTMFTSNEIIQSIQYYLYS